MLYLEDYLEMIEHLPQELRDRFTEIREMDLQVQNSIDTLEDRTSNLFLNAKKLKAEQRDAEFEKIREDYYKTLEDGDEKVHMAVQVYELVERYLRRLDQELAKFKMELEADNSGITEVLERRSLELDLPPPLNHNHQSKSEKRKHSMNSYNITNGSEKRLALLSTEKVTPTFVPEINHDPLKLSSVTCHQSSASSPFSSNHGSPSPVTCTSQTTSHLTYGLGHMASGSNAIAAAASQAIAATQQMQQGRRTASLKASFQAVNSTLQGINKEFNFGRDVAGTNPATAVAAAAAVAATSVQVNAANANLMSSSSSSANSNLSQSRSVSPAPDNMVKSSGRQKSRHSKLQHMLMQPEAEAEAEDYQEGVVVDGDQAADWTYDPDEPRYCICNQVSYGDMVACDNVDCPVEWFHYNCVGITQPPRGKWYCPQCTAAMRRRGRK